MAAQARHAVADIEKYRLQLEASVDKLRKALQHWQTWEAEYEGLKEEIQSLPENATPSELAKAALGLEGHFVNEKETKDILGLDKGAPRNASQIVSLLDRRIDYVHRNVTTVQKQFDEAELKLYNVEAVKQETLTEDGLPLTEINEELDEDGNVISAEVTHPGQSSDKVLDVLKRAGIDEKELKEDEDNLEDGTLDSPKQEPKVSSASLHEVSAPSAPKKSKSVSFASVLDIAPEPAPPILPASKVQPAKAKSAAPTVPGITNLAAGSFPPTSRVIELDENDMPIAVNAPLDPIKNPIIPPNESEEDARLRREMLQYSMSEVGAVVAQLDLEERGSDESEFSDENYDIDEDDAADYEYGGTSASDDEDEDEHGMSRRNQITDSYKREMEALEAKLKGHVFANLGPRPPPEILDGSLDVTDDEDEAAKRLATDAKVLRIQRDEEAPLSGGPDEETGAPARGSKKGVRFAETLDISPAPTPVNPSPKPAKAKDVSKKPPPPLSEVVQERSPSTSTQNAASTPARKPSRFKSARASTAAPEASPTNPLPLADKVLERAPGSSQAKPPSKNDPEILQKQLGMEYVRQRNNMIYKQGGFMKEGTFEEDAEIDADEHANQRPVKKMSRFMAARVRDT